MRLSLAQRNSGQVLPSFYTSNNISIDLAEWVLFFGNFDLGIGLILNFHLPTTSVLSATVLNLVKANHWKRVEELVQRVKKILVDTEDWDNFATSCIKTFMEMGNSTLAGKMVDCILLHLQNANFIGYQIRREQN